MLVTNAAKALVITIKQLTSFRLLLLTLLCIQFLNEWHANYHPL